MSVRRRVPVAALCTNSVVVAIIGCLYLGSSTAFNAFIGTGLILQLITFAIPAALLLLQRRPARLLPKTRTFGLPRISGWIANFFTVGFALACLVFYDLPAILPATASNMSKSAHRSLNVTAQQDTDYSPAVIGIVCILMALNWVFWARKHFNGPRLPNLE
jgi:choline transport protein